MRSSQRSSGTSGNDGCGMLACTAGTRSICQPRYDDTAVMSAMPTMAAGNRLNCFVPDTRKATKSPHIAACHET